MTGSGTPSQGKKNKTVHVKCRRCGEILPRQEGALLLVRLRRLGLPPRLRLAVEVRRQLTTALSLSALSVLVSLALASAFLAGSLRPLSDTFWLLWSPTRPPGSPTVNARIADGEYGSLDRRSLAGPGGRDRRRRVREHGDSRGAGRAARLLAVLGRRASRHGRSPGRDDSRGPARSSRGRDRLDPARHRCRPAQPLQPVQGRGGVRHARRARAGTDRRRPRSGQRLARVRPGARHGPTRREPGRGPRGTYPCGREPSVRRLPR